MSKTPPNHGRNWTEAENRQLRDLAKGNTPTRVAALKMGRTPAAVQAHANEIGLSLKPSNQSPYGTKK